MIIVFPISLNDQELALKNVKWWNELGGCKSHECLFIPDARCSQKEPVLEELKKCFNQVHVFQARAEIDGWPEGANYMFRTATAWLSTSFMKWTYFMWMEPDAIPLQAGWADKIEDEHLRNKKPFTGDRVQVEDIPLHMSGIGVYPNPLHAYAGEAYRAVDVAWDMAGKDQIVPRAHFTKLIEHAWKHPSFSDLSELNTQIRKEAIVFHASKDGSLIDLLRSKKGKETISPASINLGPNQPKEREEPRSPSPSPTCDIFIRTYPGDYKWLDYCLKSIAKFCTGFRKVWIITPQCNPQPEGSLLLKNGSLIAVQWKEMQDETQDGYLAQQITKMYADVITGYQPDYILHVDSDVIFTRPTTPVDFLSDGKPIAYYTPYTAIETPWQPITEKFLNDKVEFEFMRRFPILMPRWIYPRIREFCHKTHGVIISDYIRMQPARAFSEFNAMGAYAYKYHREMFRFINTLEITLPMPQAIQFHSWGGITPEAKNKLDVIFSDEEPSLVAGGGGPSGGGLPSLPEGVKELPNGLWVIEGDTHISKWIEQQGRLDHDQNTLPFILPLIKECDVVVDGGAFVGDHTIAYLQKVGVGGEVHAFEPNPMAMQCLRHNLAGIGNLCTYEAALGRNLQLNLSLSGNNNNLGGAYLGEHMPVTKTVTMLALDNIGINPDLIKLDIEGCEVEALIGMQETIRRCHPIMVIEVNQGALERQGKTVGELFALLESHGYEWTIMQENASADSPMYDIIARHTGMVRTSPEVSSQGNGEVGFRCSEPPPPVASPRPIFDMLAAVSLLKTFAETSPNHRQRLMINLSKSGLTPRNRKRKKKHAKTTAPVAAKKETPISATPPIAPGKGERAGHDRKRQRLVSTPRSEKGTP